MKLVVLGRDGVINEEQGEGVIRADNWKPVPGSLEAIARLCRSGFRVVVATNQQQISAGTLGVEELHDVHRKMLSLVHETGGTIDAVFFAPSGNPDGHGKRQPKVALLRQIENRYGVDLAEVVVIGDSREDLEAAKSVGARAVLVRTGHGVDMLGALTDFEGVTIFKDLAGAVDQLVAEAQHS
ncbi:MAG: HAD-IIIA family hydrolase [Xanthomonadales bacterium]|nr:HAD-IIIA family hydrolase [Xanthomonadales bacterium]